MKLAKNTDLVLNILYSILCAVLIATLIPLIINTYSILKTGTALIKSSLSFPLSLALSSPYYQTNSLLSACNSILKMLSNGVSVLSNTFLIEIIIISAILIVPLLIITIVAYIRMIKYTITKNPEYIRKNIRVKLIYSCIGALIAFFIFLRSSINFFSIIIFIIYALFLTLLITCYHNTKIE